MGQSRAVPQPEETEIRCRVVVRGCLTQRLATAFPGMRVEPATDTSVISGVVRDQAQLLGLLERAADFGLHLVSFDTVAAGTAAEHSAEADAAWAHAADAAM